MKVLLILLGNVFCEPLLRDVRFGTSQWQSVHSERVGRDAHRQLLTKLRAGGRYLPRQLSKASLASEIRARANQIAANNHVTNQNNHQIRSKAETRRRLLNFMYNNFS